MKKLMIAVAAVACAAVANAANFYWGVSDKNYMDEGGHAPMGATYLDHTLSVYLASDWANFDGTVAGLAAMTALQGPVNYSTAYGPEAVAYTGVYIDSNGNYFQYGADELNSLDVVFVDVDGTQSGYSILETTLTGTLPTSSEKAINTVDPAVAASAFSSSYTEFSTPTPPGPGPDPTPEPTSGLLMLVGLAGLALKRKIA